MSVSKLGLGGAPLAGDFGRTDENEDAHQHYWKLDRGDYGWLRENLGPVLFRDYLPEHLIPELRRNGVGETVLVQAAPTMEETEFMLNLSDQEETVLGIVGWLDVASPEFEAHYAGFREHPVREGDTAVANGSGSLSSDELLYLQHIEKNDPIQPFLERYLERERDHVWEPSSWRKEDYLKFAEDRFRQFVGCLNDAGAVVDPFEGKERQFVTSSFAMTGAVLLSAGRCDEHEGSVLKAMDWAVDRLRRGETADNHADFTTHMLMTAFRLLLGRASSSDHVAAWREGLASLEPERIYSQTERNYQNIRLVRNWSTYAMLGEQMRIRDGLADTTEWIDKYLESQLPRFTPEGLYRDPNLPAAYDMAARDNLAGLLAEGYEDPYTGLLGRLLRRGALAMLFTQSVTGETSCGGRSNQFLWNELTFAHICEREATYYRSAGNDLLAGMFKQAAGRAMRIVERWASYPEVSMVKNRFPAASRTGCEFYAFHSNYLLYAAKIAASCYLKADDAIAETPAPCDTGDYVFHLPSFNQVYATGSPLQGHYHVCIDTAAQMGHDATGWVRLHRAGIPAETALSMGIAGQEGDVPLPYIRPGMRIAPPFQSAAIGLQWRDEHGSWYRLAGYGRRKHEVFYALNRDGIPIEPETLAWRAELRSTSHRSEHLRFEIVYSTCDAGEIASSDDNTAAVAFSQVKNDVLPRPGIGSCAIITECYTISPIGITAEWKAASAEGGRITGVAVLVPILETNGMDRGEVTCHRDGSVALLYLNGLYTVEPIQSADAAQPALELLPGLMPNRNGHYRLAQWTLPGSDSISLHFSLEQAELEMG